MWLGFLVLIYSWKCFEKIWEQKILYLKQFKWFFKNCIKNSSSDPYNITHILKLIFEAYKNIFYAFCIYIKMINKNY